MGRKTKKQRARAKAKGSNETPVVLDEAYRRMPDSGYSNPIIHNPSRTHVDDRRTVGRESIPEAALRRARQRQAGSQMPSTAKVGVRQQRKDGPASDAAMEFLEGLRKLGERIKTGQETPQDVAQAQGVASRLEAFNAFLKKDPVPILDQLRGLGLQVTIHENVQGQPHYNTVVLLLREVKAADRKIKAEGTLYEQLSRGIVP